MLAKAYAGILEVWLSPYKYRLIFFLPLSVAFSKVYNGISWNLGIPSSSDNLERSPHLLIGFPHHFALRICALAHPKILRVTVLEDEQPKTTSPITTHVYAINFFMASELKVYKLVFAKDAEIITNNSHHCQVKGK